MMYTFTISPNSLFALPVQKSLQFISLMQEKSAQINLKPLLFHPSNTLLAPQKHHKKIMARSLVVGKRLDSTTFNTNNMYRKLYHCGMVLHCNVLYTVLEFEVFGGLRLLFGIVPFNPRYHDNPALCFFLCLYLAPSCFFQLEQS